MNFEPFIPPRSSYSVGSVITIDPRSGQDALVVASDRCLPEFAVPRHRQPIGNIIGELTYAGNQSFIGRVISGLLRGLNLEAALQIDSVKQIRYRFENPRVEQLEESIVVAYTKSMRGKNICGAILTNPDNLIIHTVFIADGIEFSFHGRTGARLDVSSSIRRAIGLSVGSGASQSDRSSLRMSGESLQFGFRV